MQSRTESSDRERCPAEHLGPSCTTRVAKDTILVVDDNRDLVGVTIDLLEAIGYLALPANNGHDALTLLKANPQILLLLADVRMPGMSGIALAIQAQKIRPGLKILFTTAFADLSDVENELMTHYPVLRKPYSLRSLSASVQKLLPVS